MNHTFRAVFILFLIDTLQAFHMAGFPSSAFVVTAKKELKGIAEVVVGDELFYVDPNGVVKPDRVVSLLINDFGTEEMFLSIKTITGEKLEIKPKQLVFEVLGYGKTASKFAKEIKVGDKVIALNKAFVTEVVEVGMVKLRGVHLPMTESGYIFVNGVLVSCLNTYKASQIQSGLMAYYQKAVDWLPDWLQDYTHYSVSGKHWMQHLFETMVQWYG